MVKIFEKWWRDNTRTFSVIWYPRHFFRCFLRMHNNGAVNYPRPKGCELATAYFAKIGTDKDHMVEIKAAMDVVLYLTSLINLDRKVEGSVEQLLKDVCNGRI